jgi:hypothetical protein
MIDMEIDKVAFNFIYTMHYDELVIFLTFFQLLTWYMSWTINFQYVETII